MAKKKRLVQLAQERTVLAEERTILSNIRTWFAAIGILLIVGKIYGILSWWPIFVALIVIVSIILVEEIYKFIKIRKKEKELRAKTKI